MPLHDRRYKRLHRPQAVNLAWAQQLSDQLGLGTVLPDSVVPHPVEYLTEELTLRLADHAWSFRTERMQGLPLMMEFQSSQDAALALRQYTYAFLHLLAGLEAKEYNLRQGLPIPILVSSVPRPPGVAARAAGTPVCWPAGPPLSPAVVALRHAPHGTGPCAHAAPLTRHFRH